VVYLHCAQTDETISLDSDSEEPSPEALARYLTMRRHTVGIAHPQNETAAPAADVAHYFTQHHHHHQPAGTGPFLHPPMFAPGVAAAHGLPHIFMPQDLSAHSASEDESLPTNLSVAIADHNLLRPPQIPGMIAVITVALTLYLCMIRPHHSTVNVDAPYCYRWSSVVCRSTSVMIVNPAKNGCIDQHAVWVVDSGELMEPFIRWGLRSAHGKGPF